jgi:hypothetical protein
VAYEGWDPHLRDALILVACMAVGVVLGALSRHVLRAPIDATASLRIIP